MYVGQLTRMLSDCPCGRVHDVGVRSVEISAGCRFRAADILSEQGFPKRILLVAQRETLCAADGIGDVLRRGGFSLRTVMLDTPCIADTAAVERLLPLCGEADGLLSVGAGAVGDVCRRAASLADKAFAVFATAASMDGFASDTAPILQNGFKISLPARQPSVILADTEILSAAPAYLTAAGYADMLAKYIALAEWRIAHCLTGEYYCELVAALTRDALQSVVDVTDRIQRHDPHAVETLMRALVTTGIAMHLCGSSRPAGGAEHVTSHFWESMQTLRNERTDLHGRKVGAATVMIARLYHALVRTADPARFCADTTNWARVYAAYGDAFTPQIRRCNQPSVTDGIPPQRLQNRWDEICRIVDKEIPPPEQLDDCLRRAGAARTPDEIGVDEALAEAGLQYHPYMRRRVLLSRLIPMLGVTPDYRAAALARSAVTS